MLRFFLFCFLIFFVFNGCFEQKKKQQEEIVSVEVQSPEQKEVAKKIEYHGLVESPKIVQIKNRIDGFLQKQYFQNGSFIQNGTLLYKIDDTLLKTELQSLQAQLRQSLVNLENLEKIKIKNEKLFGLKVATQQDLDNATVAYEKEKYNADIIRANIRKINVNLSYTKIYAPISGYIEKSQYNEGSYVPASGTYLTNIYQSNPLYFSAQIPIGNKNFQDSIVELDTQTIKAKLAYCDPAADINSGLLNCKFEFFPDNKIEINSYGKLILSVKASGIFIPQKALVQGEKGKAVYLYKDGKAILQDIVVGLWIDKNVEVLSGVNLGDLVIVQGVANLRNDVAVKIGK